MASSESPFFPVLWRGLAPVQAAKLAAPAPSRRRCALPAVALAAVLTSTLGLAQAQSPQGATPTATGPIERIKLTDNELTCAQIRAEVGRHKALAHQR